MSSRLELDCEIGRQWTLALGPAKVGVGFDVYPESHGALIVTIKKTDGTAQAWKIGDDDRPLCLEQTGRITTRIGRNQIEIAPTVGATIRITDPHQTGTSCRSDSSSSAPTSSGTNEPPGITIVTVQQPRPTQSVPTPGRGSGGGGNSGGGGDPEPGTSTSTVPAQAVIELGGFSGNRDLNHYCVSKGYKEAYATNQDAGAYNNWICRGNQSSDTEPHSGYLNFVDACTWAYQRPIARAEPRDAGSPYTWSCFCYE